MYMSEIDNILKGQRHEISTKGFLRISFPQAPEYPIIQNYSKVLKFSEIFAAHGAPQVANGKFFNQKSFNCFVWTPLITRVNI
jgi:hypothetical protein